MNGATGGGYGGLVLNHANRSLAPLELWESFGVRFCLTATASREAYNWVMAKTASIDWIRSVLNESAKIGFRRAYEQVRIDPQKYMRTARRKYRLPIRRWSDARMLDRGLVAAAAQHVVSSSAKTAALEGMGFGFYGFLGAVPDMGILAAITVRMLQKLSLIHGFEYSTSDEVTGLWLAAASAAGLDYGRDFLQKQAADKLVPRIVDQVACKVGTEVAEKWAGRIVPVLSAGVAGTLNYYFVRGWGRRAHRHFTERHRGLFETPIRPFLVAPSTTPA